MKVNIFVIQSPSFRLMQILEDVLLLIQVQLTEILFSAESEWSAPFHVKMLKFAKNSEVTFA